MPIRLRFKLYQWFSRCQFWCVMIRWRCGYEQILAMVKARANRSHKLLECPATMDISTDCHRHCDAIPVGAMCIPEGIMCEPGRLSLETTSSYACRFQLAHLNAQWNVREPNEGSSVFRLVGFTHRTVGQLSEQESYFPLTLVLHHLCQRFLK